MEKKKEDKKGISRRGFFQSVGAGAVVVGAGCGMAGLKGDREHADAAVPAGGQVPIELSVNGRRHRLLVEPRWSLLYVLRDSLGLTAAKEGCGRGECGACTVLIDGLPRYACLSLAVEAEGTEITTLEGLMQGEQLGPVQQAFVETDAFQCGFCTPGQVVAVEGLLRQVPAPDLEAIRLGTSGNLCRCGAYHNIARAAERSAELRKKGG